MTRTFSGVTEATGGNAMGAMRSRDRSFAHVAIGALFAFGLLISPARVPAHAQQNTASISVDYGALDALSQDDEPLVIPPVSGKPIVLRPPHGVARYTPSKIKVASLAAYDCPCARHLVLRHTHAKKKRMRHAKSAAINPAAAVVEAPPAHTRQHTAEAPTHPPLPRPAVSPSKPAAETAPAAKPVAAPPPPPSPPAKVATAAPVPAPAAPSPPTTTQWSNTDTSPVKPLPAPAAPPAASPQVLTPPPLAKAPETAAPAPPPVQSADAKTAPAKPVEITKPTAEVAAAIPPAVKPADAKVAIGAPTVVSYAGGGTTVPTESLPAVKDISDRLAADPNLRVQLFSYASDPEKNVSRARRLSLERAVAVRKLLIDNGLDSTRIEVRALGDQNNGGEADRVDVVLSARR